MSPFDNFDKYRQFVKWVAHLRGDADEVAHQRRVVSSKEGLSPLKHGGVGHELLMDDAALWTGAAAVRSLVPPLA
jgi:hypothetical protein